MNVLISVIVPVYNAAQYLNKCIKSIQNQTYRNLQIVLVNDGSTDNSLSICQKKEIDDPRIKVISQNNMGVVSARKIGVKYAKGQFICWVDADDWIEEDYIERLAYLQNETQADIVAVGHYHDIGSDSMLVQNGIKKGVYTKDEIIPNMICVEKFFQYGIGPHLYTKLFSTNILKKTQEKVSNEIIAGDDAAVVYSAILESNKICVSDIAGYHYVQRPNSITKSNYSNEQARIDVLIDFLTNVFIEKNVLDKTAEQLRIYRNYMLTLRKIDAFDEGKESILIPYGGINKSSDVIIYGAGVLGQKIYNYLDAVGVKVIAWVDKNWSTYRKNGFDVCSPDVFFKSLYEYNFIIIANITYDVAVSIKSYLVENGIEANKILWFAEDFTGNVF